MSDENIVYLVRIHGRGGQGGVTAAQLCVNAFDGMGVCMPRFGAERMGSPTESYARMSKTPELVRTNEQVYSPQYVCVLDDSLLFDVDCAAGLPPGGFLIVNTCRPIEEIKGIIKREDINYALIDATNLALEYLGRNITNTVILGGLVKVAPQLFTNEQLGVAIADQFKSVIAQKNLDAIKVAPEKTIVHACSEDIKLDFNADYKKAWSHVELGKLGFEQMDKAGVWYTKDIDGGSARVNTGSWGVAVATFHSEYCTNCHQCVFICPDFAIKREERDGKMYVVSIDEFHCKGCESCVLVCKGRKDKETGEWNKALTMKMKC
jgi:2-oxoacid:acceptor oxidoreductase gamma subunit (pyruvate/2-ketoisovalerate family)